MINGTYGQVGFKEEQSDLLQPLRSPSPAPAPGFHRALRSANDQPAAKSAASADRSAPYRNIYRDDPQPPAQGDSSAPETDTEGEKLAPSVGQAQPEARETGRHESIQTAAEPQPQSASEQVPIAPDGTILTRTGEDQAALSQAAPFTAFGLATYLHSRHGSGEEQAAAEQGLKFATAGEQPGKIPLEQAARQIMPGAVLDMAQADKLPELEIPTGQRGEGFVLESKGEEELALEEQAESQRRNLLEAIRQQPEAQAPRGPSMGLAGSAFLQSRPIDRGPTDAMPSHVNSVDADLTAAHAPVNGPTAAEKGTMAGTFQADRTEQRMLERIVADVKWALRNNQNEVTIRLEPDHLGAMRLKITQSDGMLNLEITVDNHQARVLLESRLSELREQLGLENLEVDEFTVNVNVQEGNDWDDARQSAQTRQEPAYPAWLREQPVKQEPVLAQADRPIWGRSGVGLYA